MEWLRVPLADLDAEGRAVVVGKGNEIAVFLVDGTAGEPGAELTLEQVLLVEKDGGEVVAGAPARVPNFTNVYVNPSSYRSFMKTGQWPEKRLMMP